LTYESRERRSIRLGGSRHNPATIAQQPGGRTVDQGSERSDFDNRAAEYRLTEWLRAMRVIATRRGKHG